MSHGPSNLQELLQRRLAAVVPLRWLRGYDRGWLRPDLVAGLTTWGVMTPSAMAYAQLAGLRPEHGLYAALAALVGYGLFASSRFLKVTASSTMAVTSAAVVGRLAGGDPALVIGYSAALALVMGLLLLVAGFARLGFIADFLAQPIVKGFIVGLSLVIIVGQLPKILGVPGGEGNALEQLGWVLVQLGEVHSTTVILGACTIAAILALKRYLPLLPSGLAALAVGIGLSILLGLAAHGVSVVGQVPRGLPSLTLPAFDLFALPTLLAAALGIGFLAVGETLGTARAFAQKHRDRLDADQELLALGAANLGASLVQGFVVDASLSASATAEGAGAKSQLASLVAAALVLVTLLLLAPLFTQLPNAILAAIVITSVLALIDLRGLAMLYRQRRADFLLALTALLGVLLSGVLTGLLLAVLLGLVLVLYQSSRPRLAVLGAVPEHPDAYTDLARNPENRPVPGLLMARIDAPLYYFNVNHVVGHLRELIDAAAPAPRALLLDVGSSADLDLSTMDVLRSFVAELRERDISVLFSHVRGPVRDRLERLGVLGAVEEQLFLSTGAAVRALEGRAGAPVAAAGSTVQASAVGAAASGADGPDPQL